METGTGSQIEELKKIIKELPYQEKSVVKERSEYYYSGVGAYLNLLLGGLLIFAGIIGGTKGGDKGLYLSVLALILGAWQISKYMKQLGTKTPVVVITDSYIEYLGKTYEWRYIANAETYESRSLKGRRSSFFVNFDYEDDSVSIDISELDTGVASFLFQLYSHKLNYLIKYGAYYIAPPQGEV